MPEGEEIRQRSGEDALRAPEQIALTPTEAADAVAGRIDTRIKRGFMDIAAINASAIGFALGTWADSKPAMIATAVAGTVATGKFVKDLVSMHRNNPPDAEVVSDAEVVPDAAPRLKYGRKQAEADRILVENHGGLYKDKKNY